MADPVSGERGCRPVEDSRRLRVYRALSVTGPLERAGGNPNLPAKSVLARKRVSAELTVEPLIFGMHALGVSREVSLPDERLAAVLVRTRMGPRSVGVVRLEVRVVVPDPREELAALLARPGGFTGVRELSLLPVLRRGRR